MKVLLIQVDEKMTQRGMRESKKGGDFPNLGLMKLSALFKRRGDDAGFHVSDPDKVFVSVIFSKNYSQAKGIPSLYPGAEVFIGGPGAGGGRARSVSRPGSHPRGMGQNSMGTCESIRVR